MYVVPKWFDALFTRDDSWNHQQVIAAGAFSGHKCVNFPIDGVRPLIGPPGTLFGWYGNVIHWGSSVHEDSPHQPRASVAWVFRRASSDGDPDCAPLTEQQVRTLTQRQRLELVVSSLKTFKHWYKIPKPMVRRLRAIMGGKKSVAVKVHTGLPQ